MAKNAMIDHLREERALRDQLAEHVRDILLSLRREGLFVACAAAEGHDDHLGLFGHLHGAQRCEAAQRARRGKTDGVAKEATPVKRSRFAARSREAFAS